MPVIPSAPSSAASHGPPYNALFCGTVIPSTMPSSASGEMSRSANALRPACAASCSACTVDRLPCHFVNGVLQ